MIDPRRLRELLDQFPTLHIALVGDLFLDRYLEIDSETRELSIETGLEAYQVSTVRNSPGALGTVMNNLHALGVGRLTPVSVVGADGHAFDLLRSLPHPTVDASNIVQAADRLTPTYTKPIRRREDGGWEELNRLDVRTRGPLTRHVQQQLTDALRVAFAAADGLIVLDQVRETNWGVINEATRTEVANLSREMPEKLVFVDSRAHLHKFESGILKGNRDEVIVAAQRREQAAKNANSDDSLVRNSAAKNGDTEGGVTEDGVTENSVESAVVGLARRTGRPVFCTRGESGILVACSDGSTQVSPGVPVDGPVDIVGAGDSATAALVTSLLCNASAIDAADVANLVASITVQQLGTTGTAKPEQVLDRRSEFQNS